MDVQGDTWQTVCTQTWYVYITAIEQRGTWQIVCTQTWYVYITAIDVQGGTWSARGYAYTFACSAAFYVCAPSHSLEKHNCGSMPLPIPLTSHETADAPPQHEMSISARLPESRNAQSNVGKARSLAAEASESARRTGRRANGEGASQQRPGAS